MKRITRKSLERNLRFTASGDIFKKDIEALENIKTQIVADEKIRFHYWSGTKKHMHVIANFDLNLLSKFCDFIKGNDGRGGIASDYIVVSKKEYKKLVKRLAYFLKDKNAKQ